mmetsp:Transcript_136144/g.248197  ORF Transcript_136144/g.248197 Transcript_136144/m.248197 type:complete len:253 (+) Transcript_136144:375-1133(+)
MPLSSSSRCLASRYSNSRTLLSDAAQRVRNSRIASSFACNVLLTRFSKSEMICSSRCLASRRCSSERDCSSEMRLFSWRTSARAASISLSFDSQIRDNSSRCFSSPSSWSFLTEVRSASKFRICVSNSAALSPSKSNCLCRPCTVCSVSARCVSSVEICDLASSSCADKRRASSEASERTRSTWAADSSLITRCCSTCSRPRRSTSTSNWRSRSFVSSSRSAVSRRSRSACARSMCSLCHCSFSTRYRSCKL